MRFPTASFCSISRRLLIQFITKVKVSFRWCLPWHLIWQVHAWRLDRYIVKNIYVEMLTAFSLTSLHQFLVYVKPQHSFVAYWANRKSVLAYSYKWRFTILCHQCRKLYASYPQCIQVLAWNVFLKRLQKIN